MKFKPFSPTPPMEVYLIADLIKDGVVYDIGSGDGAFAKEMRNFAKEVKEIEIDPKFTRTPQDFLEMNLNEAEVLYISMIQEGVTALGKKLEKDKYHGVVITYGGILYEDIEPKEKRQTFLIYEI